MGITKGETRGVNSNNTRIKKIIHLLKTKCKNFALLKITLLEMGLFHQK
jgi:hypothetical protein